MLSLATHIASHQTNGVDWPADAEFALVIRYKAWPTDYGQPHVDFFTSREQVASALDALYTWASYEDNYFVCQAYEWDLGPKPIDYRALERPRQITH